MATRSQVTRFSSQVYGLEREYKADLYYYDGDISEIGYYHFMTRIPKRSRKRNALVVMTTWGGNSYSAYKIASFFLELYDKVYTFVPTCSKSAGTLVLLGAHEIIMGKHAELGPIDPQIISGDNSEELIPALETSAGVRAAVAAVMNAFADFSGPNRKVSAGREILNTENLIASALAGLISKVDLRVLAKHERAIANNQEYAYRLVERTGVAEPDTVRRLVREYPDHSFRIDIVEARQLFKSVSEPMPELTRIAIDLQATRGQTAANFVGRLSSSHKSASEAIEDGIHWQESAEGVIVHLAA